MLSSSTKATAPRSTQINFVGNNAYSDGRLAAVIATKESGIFSFLTRKDVYNEDKLRADEEALRQFYYNRGYADFRDHFLGCRSR